jgi:CBS domain-containing protein
MSAPVESISPNLSVFDAIRIMEDKHIKRLPILEKKRLVGIVTQTDMVRVVTFYGRWKDVEEIMSRDVAGIQSKATTVEAAEVMTRRKISCIVVLEGDEVVGVVTERDLLERVVALQKDPGQIKMEEVMSSPVATVSPDYSVFSSSRIMEKMGIRRLVITDDIPNRHPQGNKKEAANGDC